MTSRRIHPAVIYGGVAAVGGATLAVSAYFQYQLGLLAGSQVVAATLPVALDAGGFVASVCWLVGHGALRAWGRGVTVALVLASTVVNVLAHGLMHGPEWAALGVVYPLVFAAMVKFALLYQEQTRDLVDALTDLSHGDAVRAEEARRAGEHTEAMQRLATEANTAAEQAEKRERDATTARQRAEEHREATPRRTTTATPPKRGATGGDVTTAVRWATERLAAGESAGWRTVATQFGLSEHQAKQAAKAAKEQHEQTPRLAVAK